MRLLILLIVLMLCAFVSLIGCDRVMQQPIMEIITPPQSSLEKAQAAMEKVNQRRTEAHQKAEETGDFSTVFTASEEIFKNELGFRKELWIDLVEIYRQENLGNAARLQGLENLEDAFAEKVLNDTLGMFYFTYISAFDALIVEYLRLSFEFPEKSEEELLALFRESVTDEKIIVIFP
ncbi:hypothetical protein C6499_09305 [Candidatus Poribacteria bacterium]|nr:MAG: hypothetical protein C6499_09305 [Candidatus Poribacteria bacterium]